MWRILLSAWKAMAPLLLSEKIRQFCQKRDRKIGLFLKKIHQWGVLQSEKKKEQPFDFHEYCSFKACSEDFLVCQTVGGVSHAKLGTYLRDIQIQWISGIYISPFTSHGGHVLRRRWHHCETLPCLSPKQHVSLFKDQIIPPSLFCIWFCSFSPFWGRAAHYFEEVMEHVRI